MVRPKTAGLISVLFGALVCHACVGGLILTASGVLDQAPQAGRFTPISERETAVRGVAFTQALLAMAFVVGSHFVILGVAVVYRQWWARTGLLIHCYALVFCAVLLLTVLLALTRTVTLPAVGIPVLIGGVPALLAILLHLQDKAAWSGGGPPLPVGNAGRLHDSKSMQAADGVDGVEFGRACIARKEYAAAREHLLRALERDPGNAEAARLLRVAEFYS